MLNWEVGLIVKQILSFNSDKLTDGEKLTNLLLPCSIASPRGILILDPKTNYFVTQVYRCNIQKSTNNLIIDTIEFSQEEWEKFVSVITTGVVSGLTNTYLCYK